MVETNERKKEIIEDKERRKIRMKEHINAAAAGAIDGPANAFQTGGICMPAPIDST